MSEKSYNILKEFCTNEEWRNKENSGAGTEEPTVRVSRICEVLDSESIKYNLDKFDDTRSNSGKFYFNVEVGFKAKEETDETVIFTAHHDIVDPQSENCQDNTASVVNLLELCMRLSTKDLNRNVYVVFTDCEEFGGLGAQRLSERILKGILGEVKDVFNSELTGLGRNIWMEAQGVCSEETLYKIDVSKMTVKSCPFNDSVVFRRNGINSICFGILPNVQINEGYSATWRLCHRKADKFELSNGEDMDFYVDFLERLV